MSSRDRGVRGRSADLPRRGPLSGMSAPPIDEMPKMRTAFTRGLAGTWSSPVVVGALVAWLGVEWLAVVLLGYPGPFALLAQFSAPAPLSTTADLALSVGIFGFGRGVPLVFIVAAVHALWYALLTGLAIEAVETGAPSRWGAIRGLRAFPVAFGMHVIGVPVLFASEIVAAIGGAGLALFLRIAILIVAVWAFAFAPVIAISERRRVIDCFRRSIRAARLPGSGNMSFATLYVVPILAAFLSPQVPGAFLDVNPPFTAWIFVVVLNLLHAAVLAAFAMRYLSVAHLVPDAPARGKAPERGTGRATRRRPSR